MTELCTPQVKGPEMSPTGQHLILAHCQCLGFNIRDCMCSYCMKWKMCPPSLPFTKAGQTSDCTAPSAPQKRHDYLVCYYIMFC